MPKTTKDRLEELTKSDDIIIKEKAIKDIEICKQCPDFEKCTDCDDTPWEWWKHMTLNVAKPKPNLDLDEDRDVVILVPFKDQRPTE